MMYICKKPGASSSGLFLSHQTTRLLFLPRWRLILRSDLGRLSYTAAARVAGTRISTMLMALPPHLINLSGLDFLALLCYNGGGRGKAPGSPLGVLDQRSVVGALIFLFDRVEHVLHGSAEIFKCFALVDQFENHPKDVLGSSGHFVHFLTSSLRGAALPYEYYYTPLSVYCLLTKSTENGVCFCAICTLETVYIFVV